MTERNSRRWWDVRRAPRLSPMGLMMRAGLIAAAFAAAHLAGLRGYVGLLTGVTAGTGTGSPLEMIFAVLYIVLYGALVLIAPVLVAAAGLLFVCLLALPGAEGRGAR
jgi:hypothetical protein